MQQSDVIYKSFIEVQETRDLKEIKETLYSVLYVPIRKLKSKIIEELISYLNSKFLEVDFKIKVFIAYNKSNPTGFVVSMIHPNYTSYSRKCGSFGWLIAKNFESCKKLLEKCEMFMNRNKIRKIRGNINFPKGLGGMGVQSFGFDEQMMYGVSFNDPNSKVLNYLDKLGYKRESEYTCMKVTKKIWTSGKKIDKDIKLGYLTLKELIKKKEEIRNLAEKSFNIILPDRSGFDEKFDEMIHTYSQVPNSHYKIKEDFNPKIYSEIPEFIEAWESCELERVVTWCPMAFDRRTEKIIGAILSLPDLYELWQDKRITRNNVDTVMVNKNYAGKGIFSALNNIGQLTCNLNGIKYYEGTYIWSNNKDAVNAIFPHCEHIRKHIVFQKRV